MQAVADYTITLMLATLAMYAMCIPPCKRDMEKETGMDVMP